MCNDVEDSLSTIQFALELDKVLAKHNARRDMYDIVFRTPADKTMFVLKWE